MERTINTKCYIGDILHFVMVNRDIIINKVLEAELYQQKVIAQIVINKDEGISYWKDCYEMIAGEEDVDSYKPCNWTSPDIFVFSSAELADQFVTNLKDIDYANKITWW